MCEGIMKKKKKKVSEKESASLCHVVKLVSWFGSDKGRQYTGKMLSCLINDEDVERCIYTM